jgi:hypothetical protein
VALGVGLAMAGGLAACSASTTATSTTTTSASTTASTAAPPTTTLTQAQEAALKPLLLTGSDFPSGWAQDTATDAAGTKGTPSCVADLVLLKDSNTRSSVVFADAGSSPTAVIQTVGLFSPGKATASAKMLKSTFESCNGGTLSSGQVKATIGIKAISVGSTGDAGFAAQMILTEGAQSSYLDVLYAVKGSNGTFLGWSTTTASTTFFAQLASIAVAKL